MVFIRCNLHCCYKGFVLWIFIEGVPSEPRTSGSFFSLEFSGLHYCLFVNVLFVFFVAVLSDATLIGYHKLLYLVKNFFIFLFKKIIRFLDCLSVFLSDEDYLTTLLFICQQEIVSFFINFSFPNKCLFFLGILLYNSLFLLKLCELCNILSSTIVKPKNWLNQ